MSKTIINSNGTGGISTLTVPASSTDREITIWSGTTGTVLAGGHGVLISPAGDIVAAQSVSLTPELANPGGNSTLWVNSGNGHLYRGSTDVEGSGLTPGTAKVIPVYDTAGTGITPSSFKLGADTTNLCITEAANPARDTTLGINNTAIGYGSGSALDVGSNGNTLVGQATGKLMKGNANVAVGTESLATAPAAGFCTAIGAYAMTGDAAANLDSCVAVGSYAMTAAKTCTTCVAVGNSAMNAATNSIGSVAVGSHALTRLNGGAANTAVGNSAASHFTALSGASNNTAIGNNSMGELVNGVNNTAVGGGSLAGVFTGTSTATSSVAVGQGALGVITNSVENVAVGAGALSNSTSAVNNTALGTDALNNITTGGNNTALGRQAGATLTTGNNNIYIGSGVLADSAIDSGITKINTVSGTKLKIGGVYGNTELASNFTASHRPIMVDAAGQFFGVNPSFCMMNSTCQHIYPNGGSVVIGGVQSTLYEILTDDTIAINTSISNVFTKAASPNSSRVVYNGTDTVYISAMAIVCFQDSTTGSTWNLGFRRNGTNYSPSFPISTNGSGKVVQAVIHSMFACTTGTEISVWMGNMSSSNAATVNKVFLTLSIVR